MIGLHSHRLTLLLLVILAGCGGTEHRGPYAPGIAEGPAVDGLVVGDRLLAAGEAELALRAYYRAAAADGLTADLLTGLGAANLALGRLGQAERLLREATEADARSVPAWNNLGVVLVERGRPAEAAEMFRRAFALDGGRSNLIRDNLRLALAKRGDPGYAPPEETRFALVRQRAGEYLLHRPSGSSEP